MALTPDEAVLVSGSDDEINNFISAHCCVVDWKGEWDEIVEDFNHFLPGDFVELGVELDIDDPDVEEIDFEDISGVVVTTKNGSETVSLDEPPIGLELAEAIAKILPPDFEAHALGPDGDTACYLIRPGGWWNEFRAEHPDRFASLFGG